VPETGGILTLDLASTTGWAYGCLDWNAPTFGCWHMPLMGGEGCRLASIENELIDALNEYAPSHLICEAPLPLPAATNRQAVYQQLGLRGLAIANAWRSAVAWHEIDAPTVRGELLGQRYFSKNTVKKRVTTYCRSLGLRVPDHNAGDAVMLWLWWRGQVRSAGRGPLFVEAMQC
jgi:Holliday junction resolvasome RuvABC endonuclease subunit